MSQVEKYFNNLTPFAIAIWFSVAVHAVLLAIQFEPELRDIVKRLPSLDVVLVNAKTEKAPDNAELIAQANLDRGGNTDEDRKMKTVLPTPLKQTAEVQLQEKKEASTAAKSLEERSKKGQEEKKVAELEKQANALMTQLKADSKVAADPVQKAITRVVEEGAAKENAISRKLNPEALLAASLEIDRLEAQIAKQQEEYQKRPKSRFLGARTKAADDALYLEAWRQKVERIGNMNYPAAARNQKLYGRLQLTVSIRSDGSIEGIAIDKSSGSKVLDNAAINIVKLAAPYSKFSVKMKKTTDILGITRTWTFTNEDALYTK
ncbi:MAG: protein TonB [Methylophilaceae bacterium]|jgi:protein TonB